MTEALWSRAVRAVDARGLLPARRSSLTPRELAAEASRRGEDRLAVLVESWYYPASYGRIGGMLSDVLVDRLVADLEAEVARIESTRVEIGEPATPPTPARRIAYCDLCGRALTP